MKNKKTLICIYPFIAKYATVLKDLIVDNNCFNFLFSEFCSKFFHE